MVSRIVIWIACGMAALFLLFAVAEAIQHDYVWSIICVNTAMSNLAYAGVMDLRARRAETPVQRGTNEHP
jgi:hypothetical protein